VNFPLQFRSPGAHYAYEQYCMAILESVQLGTIEYPDEHVLHFPFGLPAFEDETRFLAVERPGLAPIVFLQSLQRPDLTFPTLPVKALEPGFELLLTEDEFGWLYNARAGQAPPETASEDLIALAIVTFAGDGITANLRAPVVVNQRTRLGLQAIQADSPYSLRHPVGPLAPASDGERPGTAC
jgi:flagellar assembly factor FliW